MRDDILKSTAWMRVSMRRIALPALLLAAAVIALPTAGCSQETSNDRAFGEKVRAYLMRHPEVIEEATAQMQARQQASADREARVALTANRSLLERDGDDFVANPNGKITVVEFFDYKCTYCKASATAVLDIIAKNPDVRFVFKEMPILTDTSSKASEAQLAANKNNGKYLNVFGALMAERALDDSGVQRIMSDHGVDVARLDPNAKAAADKHISETKALAKSVGIEGTPAFVVGDHVIAGWIPEELQAGIDEGRRRSGSGS
jgi:protein-disulfide isomerase